jgi:hypothetical protein
MAENTLSSQIGYLEDEVKKIDERANELEATMRNLKDKQKKHALREVVRHLRGEVSEHLKYLALVSRSNLFSELNRRISNPDIASEKGTC